ncbi:MAG: hypothetical protein WCP89_00255 [archaeon]
MANTTEDNQTEMIERDYHSPKTAEFLKGELRLFPGKCHYDPSKKEIVYHDGKEAMRIYMEFQCREMEKYRWIESEKANRDLGDAACLDWDEKYADTFSAFWRATHKFIPVKEQTETRAQESPLAELCSA